MSSRTHLTTFMIRFNENHDGLRRSRGLGRQIGYGPVTPVLVLLSGFLSYMLHYQMLSSSPYASTYVLVRRVSIAYWLCTDQLHHCGFTGICRSPAIWERRPGVLSPTTSCTWCTQYHLTSLFQTLFAPSYNAPEFPFSPNGYSRSLGWSECWNFLRSGADSHNIRRDAHPWKYYFVQEAT